MRISDWSSDVCSSDLTTDGPKYPGGSFMGSYCSHTDMFTWLKFPAISVPCGFVDGFPVGLQFAAPPGSEATIFRVAQAYQTDLPRNERPKDRKGDALGKRVSVRVDTGGRGIIKKKNKT